MRVFAALLLSLVTGCSDATGQVAQQFDGYGTEWCPAWEEWASTRFAVAVTDTNPWVCGEPDLDSCQHMSGCGTHDLHYDCDGTFVVISMNTIEIQSGDCHDKHGIVRITQ